MKSQQAQTKNSDKVKQTESDLLIDAVSMKHGHKTSVKKMESEHIETHMRIAEFLPPNEVFLSDTRKHQLSVQEEQPSGWFYTYLSEGFTCSATPYFAQAYATNTCLGSSGGSAYISCTQGETYNLVALLLILNLTSPFKKIQIKSRFITIMIPFVTQCIATKQLL